MTSTPKLCKDCRHALKPFLGLPTPWNPWRFAKCLRSPIDADDGLDVASALVTGRRFNGSQPDNYFCATVRGSLVSGDCGPAGNLWEAKNE